MQDKFKSGFVTIVGKPNVGKSTLINSLVNKKIAIVSKRPETTRANIQGILTTKDSQIIFIDTPGIHKPHLLLGKVMVRKASFSLLEADLVLFMVELTTGLEREDLQIVDLIIDAKKPAILIINKIDLVSKSRLLPMIDELKDLYDFIDFIPISALTGDNINLLKERVSGLLSKGDSYYPDDQITDKDDKFQAAEIIREKILLLTREEVPHSVAVVIDTLTRRQDKDILDIEATIFVERDSQKGIIVGKKGSMAKDIASRSRLELEDLLGMKVFLKIWVKVLKNWRKDHRSLKRLGLE
ncbi:MAG: GTPase Era [Candidatus Omnitrophota bacterium]